MMAENSKIQWTNHTWNPWKGCMKISPGCKFCYMFRDMDRFKQDPTEITRTGDNVFYAPFKWAKDGRAFVFTCSWSDFFISAADNWREDAWEVIRRTPELTYQILTKRPEFIRDRLPLDWGKGYPNVWLGISAENQETLEKRLPALAAIPARVRFISAEPLLGPLDFGPVESSAVDWVIVGGESGNDTGKHLFRPCRLEWIEGIVQQCKRAKTPVFVKQLGTHLADKMELGDRHGGNFDEMPFIVRYRQMPNG